MGIFKKEQQIIKFEQNFCNASVNDNSVLFVRVNDVIKNKNAILEVPFTHNAFLIKGGGDCRFYKSGTHVVFEDSKEVKAWKKGISAEVIYIPKETSVLIRWGTPSKIMYRDPISAKVIAIGAHGQFGVSITNPEQFLRKVVGVRKEFDLLDFSNRFSAAVVDEFADVFLNVVVDSKISYDAFDANRKSIASKVGLALSEKFSSDWGIGLVDFIIESFNISDEDMAKVESVAEENVREVKIKEHLAELERLDDKKWERDKYLLSLEKNDKEAYYEVLKVVGENGKKGGQYCSKCGHSVESTESFCSHCGNKMGKTENTCPNCGKVITGDAKFCGECGKKL